MLALGILFGFIGAMAIMLPILKSQRDWANQRLEDRHKSGMRLIEALDSN